MPLLTRLDRQEFLDHFWDYQPGEHVTFIQPTGGGKTHLACQLLGASGVPATMLVMKPRDPVPAQWTQRLGYKEIGHWPPPQKWPWQEKPPGYTLWPKQSLTDLDADDELLAKEFGNALLHAYRKGDQVVFADEVGGLCELKLQKHLKALWMRGSGMGAGLWAATQKPSGDQNGPAVPTYMYSAPVHLFLGHDRDRRNRQRFGEIGGIDGRTVEEAVMGLRLFPVNVNGVTKHVSEQLYIRKGGPSGAYMCVIGP